MPELARYLGETEVLQSSLFLQHRELAVQLARLMPGQVRWRGASQGDALATALAEARRQLLHLAAGTLAAYAEAQELLRGLGGAPVKVLVSPPIVQRTPRARPVPQPDFRALRGSSATKLQVQHRAGAQARLSQLEPGTRLPGVLHQHVPAEPALR